MEGYQILYYVFYFTLVRGKQLEQKRNEFSDQSRLENKAQMLKTRTIVCVLETRFVPSIGLLSLGNVTFGKPLHFVTQFSFQKTHGFSSNRLSSNIIIPRIPNFISNEIYRFSTISITSNQKTFKKKKILACFFLIQENCRSFRFGKKRRP